ncbi:8088_t:CDS:2 [Funneliformis mosseae]|uniref:8088_t:CDS:1 n=1 Tax=Funneliformis mosseae TaxID=27381 RepID=A0A9N8ZN47_FUNMO|nr:8088_t:CDS:2 [Funneliformis mosseae]
MVRSKSRQMALIVDDFIWVRIFTALVVLVVEIYTSWTGYGERSAQITKGVWGHAYLKPRRDVTKILEGERGIHQSNCDELEKYWSTINPNNKVDFARWTSCLTAEIIVTTSTGTKVSIADYNNSLPNSIKVKIIENILEESLKFIESIYMFISCIMFYFSFPTLVRKFVPVIKTMYHKYRDNNIWLDAELDRIICNRKREIKSALLDQPIENNILDLLITLNTEMDTPKITGIDNKRPLTNIEISSALREIFSGMDTTRNLMCYLMFYINKYPQVKDKLIQEYESIYGDLNKKLDVTYESLDKLVYTEAEVAKEIRPMDLSFAEYQNIGPTRKKPNCNITI